MIKRVKLRPVTGGDRSELLQLASVSIDLHHPWFSMPATPEEFETYLTRFSQATAEGLLICVRDTGAIAGLINLSTIVRGRFQCASLSYAAFAPTAGQGYMSEGLSLTLDYAFATLRLHRLEANIQPGNTASRKLVERHGFRMEGYSPDFLFIDGAWRDHERWAITTQMIGKPPPTPHPTLPKR